MTINRVFVGKFNDPSSNNWIYVKNYEDLGIFDLYVSSCYFVVTTVVTVGYGDITAINSAEKLICCVLMITGVVAFLAGADFAVFFAVAMFSFLVG